MKKIPLFKVVQHDSVRYVGKADARTLVRMAKRTEMNATQEAQRPIEPKRLEEIAEYITQKSGILSTSIVIATVDDRLDVKELPGIKCDEQLYYMEFPETEQEFKDMENCFDLCDGQHRLFSFLDDYRKILDEEPFDLTFELYLKPTLRQRQLIFKNTNEKQKQVATNLLLWFRAQLNMLTGAEKTYHNVVAHLNNENCSPLKGRIIMGAEHITGGYKAKQIIALFHKVKLVTLGGKTADQNDEEMLRIVCAYLTGWENAVGSKLSERDPNMTAFSKMAGLRYMITLIPSFYAKALRDRERLTSTFVENTVIELYRECNAITPREFFDRTSDYYVTHHPNLFFVSETATVNLATQHASALERLNSEDFDPLAF